MVAASISIGGTYPNCQHVACPLASKCVANSLLSRAESEGPVKSGIVCLVEEVGHLARFL